MDARQQQFMIKIKYHLCRRGFFTAVLCFLVTLNSFKSQGLAERKTICRTDSAILYNATLTGGTRGKRIQYLGSSLTPKKCLAKACAMHKADYAFILKGLCYGVVCYDECDTVGRSDSYKSMLIPVSKTVYMSEEHRIIMDVFRGKSNKDVRPRISHNQRMDIELNIRLIQILDVDAVGQSIKLHVWTTQKWRNPLTIWDAKKYGNVSVVNVEPGLVWTPVLLLYNNADNNMKSMNGLKTKLIVNSTGHTTWFASISLKASCKINVKFFPFDEQHCGLNFGSWTNTISEMNIEPFPIGDGLQNYIENAEWQILKFSFKKENVKYKCCEESFAEVKYELSLRRKTLYYIYTLILPAATITALILIVFCLPPNSGERIALSVTTLVSMTVYLNIASKRLPASSENIPLLSLFYFLLFIQIGLSIAASTFVLKLFYRPNFMEPMPDWIKCFIIEYLGRILHVYHSKDKPEEPVQPLKKTVRFSDIITVNGSSVSMKKMQNKSEQNEVSHKSSRKLAVSAQFNERLLMIKDDINETVRLIPTANDSTEVDSIASERKLSSSKRSMTPNNDSTVVVQQLSPTSNHKPVIRNNTRLLNGSVHSLDSSVDRDMAPANGRILNFPVMDKVDKDVQEKVKNDVDTLTNSLRKKEVMQNDMYEWQLASMVVDRIFLICFILTLTVSALFLMFHRMTQAAE